MNLRKAVFPDDFESIIELNKVLSPDESRNCFERETERFKGSFFVAEEGSRVTGFSSLSFPYWNQIGLIFHLIVVEAERSKGIGGALIDEIIQEAIQERLRFVTVRTPSWNSRALAFYKRKGFVQKAVFEDYYGDGNSMVWLHKDLR